MTGRVTTKHTKAGQDRKGSRAYAEYTERVIPTSGDIWTTAKDHSLTLAATLSQKLTGRWYERRINQRYPVKGAKRAADKRFQIFCRGRSGCRTSRPVKSFAQWE
jgi:hypothetical protein